MKVKFLWKSGQFSTQRRGVPFWCGLSMAFRSCWVVGLLLTVSFADAAKVEDFIPEESVLYVKLQNIDEVYGEIEVSESWEKALALLPDESDFQQMQQGLTMVQGVLGTDLLSVTETIGYRTAFAVWSFYEEDPPEMGLVVHSGGNLSELKRFTKIVEGLIGMTDTNTLHIDAGEYQRVRYNMMKVNQQYIAKYGFVDEFLVLGVGEGAFEKLMDTFRKNTPSIVKNTHYAEISEKLGSGQVSIFCATHQIPKDTGEAHVLGAIIAEALLTVLRSFEATLVEFNLLETGEFLTLHGQFTQKSIEQFHQLVPNSERFVKEKNPFKTVKAVSPDEHLFVALSPVVPEVIWQALSKFINEEADDEIYATISFLEGLLNLNLEDDIIPSLTGELAISVHDLEQFDPSALGNLEIEFDGALTMDAGGIETQGILIFDSSNPLKWNQLSNSVSNLQNVSVSQSNYKGVTVSTFASGIYYAKVDGLFLVGSSEEQMHALIDEIKNGKSPVYFKQLPKTPIVIAQLNLAGVLEMGKGAPPSDRVLVNSSEIAPFLAWISVQDNEVLLEATLSRKETGLEALAKLLPFLIWNMERQ
jgi:hypothetical protein